MVFMLPEGATEQETQIESTSLGSRRYFWKKEENR